MVWRELSKDIMCSAGGAWAVVHNTFDVRNTAVQGNYRTAVPGSQPDAPPDTSSWSQQLYTTLHIFGPTKVSPLQAVRIAAITGSPVPTTDRFLDSDRRKISLILIIPVTCRFDSSSFTLFSPTPIHHNCHGFLTEQLNGPFPELEYHPGWCQCPLFE